MNIAVLSRRGSLYSTRRLLEAGRERGHEMKLVNYLRCYMDITSHQPQVLFQGEPLTGFDAVIPRIGASHAFYGTAVVRQFEMMGVFSANESLGISRSRDKLRSCSCSPATGSGMPVTGFAHSTRGHRRDHRLRRRRAARRQAARGHAGRRRRPRRDPARRRSR